MAANTPADEPTINHSSHDCSTPRIPPRVSATPPRSAPASVSKLSGTPISHNVSGSHQLASKVKDLANEMSGHFLGPMPFEMFLNKFLPLNPGVATNNCNPDAFAAVGKARSEKAMYEPFIAAVELFTERLVFHNTHTKRDKDRDRLSPDIAVYDADNTPDEDATIDFSRMSMFVELKHSKDADPFGDPDDPLQPQIDEFCFERDAEKPTKHRGQIGSYSAALCGSQFRVHLFSVSICGETCRLIRWDRSGATVSCQFNYVTNPKHLADFFYRYSHLDRAQQGHDTTVLSHVPRENIESMNLQHQERLQAANPQHREFRKIMVPDRGDPSQEKPFLISFPPNYDVRSPFSRSTRTMLAFDLTKETIVFLKDYWRANIPGMEKEGDIYATLWNANVPYIAPFGTGNDVRGHATVTQTLRKESWACWTKEISLLHQYRMTLEVIGRSLTEFLSTQELLTAIADAMEAHDCAYFDAKILHRDISVGNILITDDGRGTWQFMSAKLLSDPWEPHQLEDDRESCFYVLVWTALMYSNHHTSEPPLGSSLDGNPPKDDITEFLRAFDEVYADAHGRLRGGDLKSVVLLGGTLDRVHFDNRPKLDKLLKDLTRIFRVRYDKAPDDQVFGRLEKLKAQGASDEDLQDNIAFRYRSRHDKLKERKWLVNTIRSYLAPAEDWPVDKAKHHHIVGRTGSKRKRTTDRANLDARALKK